MFDPFLYAFVLVQAFQRFLSYKRDNDELLSFILRQLIRDQIAYQRNVFHDEVEMVQISEEDFIEHVRFFLLVF